MYGSNKTWAIVRDVWIVCIASFILIYETIGSDRPSEVLVGAALLMLGVPAALRLDERREKRGKNGETE